MKKSIILFILMLTGGALTSMAQEMAAVDDLLYTDVIMET